MSADECLELHSKYCTFASWRYLCQTVITYMELCYCGPSFALFFFFVEVTNQSLIFQLFSPNNKGAALYSDQSGSALDTLLDPIFESSVLDDIPYPRAFSVSMERRADPFLFRTYSVEDGDTGIHKGASWAMLKTVLRCGPFSSLLPFCSWSLTASRAFKYILQCLDCDGLKATKLEYVTC
jgi:hypothetical protein